MAKPLGGLISALGLVCAAQFVLQVDFSIVNVALPTIQRNLGFTSANLQWVVTGYALTFGALLLLGGRAGDALGRRRLLASGLALFALASLTCGLAVSPLMLILSRFVQGGAAAFVSPSALGLLTTTNAEGPARTWALGLWAASTAAGASAGIIAGGVLTQYLGWRTIFLVNLPIIAVLLLLIPRIVPDDKRSGGERQRLDMVGAALVTTSAAALIYGLSSGQQQGFGSPGTLVALVGAGASRSPSCSSSGSSRRQWCRSAIVRPPRIAQRSGLPCLWARSSRRMSISSPSICSECSASAVCSRAWRSFRRRRPSSSRRLSRHDAWSTASASSAVSSSAWS